MYNICIKIEVWHSRKKYNTLRNYKQQNEFKREKKKPTGIEG